MYYYLEHNKSLKLKAQQTLRPLQGNGMDAISKRMTNRDYAHIEMYGRFQKCLENSVTGGGLNIVHQCSSVWY